MDKPNKEKYNDFGLGDKPSTGRFRALNKDGSFNIKKTNIPFLERQNFFHILVTMHWSKLMLIIFLGYCGVNILFASIYTFIGIENLTGIGGMTPTEEFFEAFFFSAQTITTLGYGRVAPTGLAANIVAATESMMGLLTFALATGLLYGRFSRPSSKITYSENAVIAPYQDINGFMFRIINPKKNQLLEVEVSVSLSMRRDNSNLRDFHQLELERSKVVFFPSVWTIVHPIDSESPIYGMTAADIIAKDIEIIVMLKAFDESSSQTVYSRSSYKCSELVWGEKFVYLPKQEKGKTVIDVSRINERVKAPLNQT